MSRRFSAWLRRWLPTPIPSSARVQSRRVLKPECLEDRTVPSITIQFDYSLDPNGTFSNPAPRAALEAAARSLAGYLDTSLIAEPFFDGWHLNVKNPTTGVDFRWEHVTIPADTLVVRVGGRDLAGDTLAEASRYVVGRDGALAHYRRPAFAGQGGTIAFDTGTNWYFGTSPPVPSHDEDFYSVAVHELGHILGISHSNPIWNDIVVNGAFRGSKAVELYGGHFEESVIDPTTGDEVSMDPSLDRPGIRKEFTSLDFAALADLGWSVTYDPNAQPHLADVIEPKAINEGVFTLFASGDFNHDHVDDLMFNNPATGANRWFNSRPNLTFDTILDRIEPGQANQYNRVAGGDFDRDGYDDVVFFGSVAGQNRWFFSRGNYTVQKVDDRIPPGLLDGFDNVVAGDFDGNGYDDLVFHWEASGGNRWFFSQPDGSFRREDHLIPPGLADGFTHLVTGDFDGNGRDDLVLHGLDGGNRWYFSKADGTLERRDNPIARDLIGTGFDNIVAGDFNGDRRDDLLFHSPIDGRNRWFLPRADGSFEFRDSPVNREALNDDRYKNVVVGDVNGDGAADAFFHAPVNGWNVLVPGIAVAPPNPPPPRPSPSVPPPVVVPPEFSPTGNVTGWFHIQQTKSKQRRGQKTQRVRFQLRNNSNLVIRGPFRLVFDHLATTQGIKNAAGKTRYQAPKGSPYVFLSAEAIHPGEEVSVTVLVSNPSGLPVRIRPRLLAGDGRP